MGSIAANWVVVCWRKVEKALAGQKKLASERILIGCGLSVTSDMHVLSRYSVFHTEPNIKAQKSWKIYV